MFLSAYTAPKIITATENNLQFLDTGQESPPTSAKPNTGALKVDHKTCTEATNRYILWQQQFSG